MNGKNLFRGIVWLLVLALTGGVLAFSFSAKHGEDSNITPNVTYILVEVAVIVLLSVCFWFLATNRSENDALSKTYGFIASHGFITTLILVVIASLFAFLFFVLCPSVVSKDGYSSFMVPAPFIPACVLSVLAFAIPPVQVDHWSRKSEMILTVLLVMIRWLLILGIASAAAYMYWYSF